MAMSQFVSLKQALLPHVPVQQRVFQILRISAALCYIGHGAFGIITKTGWLPYFAVARINSDLGYQLMPLIGIMDITMGILMLFVPFTALVWWMAIWATWTAMLRPLAGQGIWEFFERAGNYGVPLALLVMAVYVHPIKHFFSKLKLRTMDASRMQLLRWTLRISTALLLIGHGGFGAFQQKEMLQHHFACIGLPADLCSSETWIIGVGIFEIVLGLLALVWSKSWFFLLIVFWKVFTELLYPISGDHFWEFVERWGSYGAPLSLFFLYRHKR